LAGLEKSGRDLALAGYLAALLKAPAAVAYERSPAFAWNDDGEGWEGVEVPVRSVSAVPLLDVAVGIRAQPCSSDFDWWGDTVGPRYYVQRVDIANL
jgi:hypothetical protein